MNLVSGSGCGALLAMHGNDEMVHAAEARLGDLVGTALTLDLGYGADLARHDQHVVHADRPSGVGQSA